MSEKPRRKQIAGSPFPKVEIGEPPSPVSVGRPRVDPWQKVMDQVRALAGRSAKICHHPKAFNLVSSLKKKYPEFVFVTRRLVAAGKETMGVWARLRVDLADPPMPELPSVHELKPPGLE